MCSLKRCGLSFSFLLLINLYADLSYDDASRIIDQHSQLLSNEQRLAIKRSFLSSPGEQLGLRSLSFSSQEEADAYFRKAKSIFHPNQFSYVENSEFQQLLNEAYQRIGAAVTSLKAHVKVPKPFKRISLFTPTETGVAEPEIEPFSKEINVLELDDVEHQEWIKGYFDREIELVADEMKTLNGTPRGIARELQKNLRQRLRAKLNRRFPVEDQVNGRKFYLYTVSRAYDEVSNYIERSLGIVPLDNDKTTQHPLRLNASSCAKALLGQ